MNKHYNRTPEIERLEAHLRLVRKAAGWTVEEFADKIGVVRQTITAIEKLETLPADHERPKKLTKTQYIAMRSVLEDEVENNEMLKVILDAFVDRPEKYTDQNRAEFAENVGYVALSVPRKKASNMWFAGLTAATVATITAVIGAVVISSWKKH